MNEFGRLLVDHAAGLGVSFDDRQVARFEAYRELLGVWNASINLVGEADDAALVTKHIGDGLLFARALDLDGAHGPLADIGSGAGLPGLVLKILRPDLPVALIESHRKRAAFLAEAVRVLELDGVEVLPNRVETLGRSPDHRERYGLATARRLAKLSVLLEYALPLLRIGGRAALAKGEGMDRELAEAAGVAALLGGSTPQGRAVDGRRFVMVEKIAPTAAEYPRGPGRPAKRPLRCR